MHPPTYPSSWKRCDCAVKQPSEEARLRDRPSSICSNCQKLLTELPLQANTDDDCSEDIQGVSLETLREGCLSQCYICTAIWRDLRIGHPRSYTATEGISFDSEYVLCSSQGLENQANVLELHVFVIFTTMKSPDPREITELFVLHPAGSMSTSLATETFSANCQPEIDEQLVHLDSRSTNSKESIERMQSWISNCAANHTLCTRQLANKNKKWVPPRLIEVNSMPYNQVRIVRTDEQPLSSATYVTLSHFWGHALPQRHMKPSLTAPSGTVIIETLPKTYQDAIEMTRQLKIHYLWIDQLCVPLDVSNNGDWKHLMHIVDKVFANSALTIAAAGDNDSHRGLFVNRNPRTVNPPVVELRRQNEPSRLFRVVDNSTWSREVEEPLPTRGGSMLQQLLHSGKILHFGQTQVAWECLTSKAIEILPHGLLQGPNPMRPSDRELRLDDAMRSLFRNEAPDRDLLNTIIWTRWVEIYSKASLSLDCDRLDTLSPIAKEFAQETVQRKRDYNAGLWRKNIELQLLWQVAGVPGRTWQNMAPSWSWAASNGAICQPQAWNSNAVIAEVEEIRAIRQHGNPFGKAFGGYLHIRGLICEIELSKPCNLSSPLHTWIQSVENRNMEAMSVPGRNPEQPDYEVQLDSPDRRFEEIRCCWCLPIYYDRLTSELRGLILAFKPSKRAFVRLGSFWIWEAGRINLLLRGRIAEAGHATFPEPSESIVII